MSYDAFISYSRSDGEELAFALRTGLQKLGKTWKERRSLRVFLDRTSLEASSRLQHDLFADLDSSRFLVLLASPASASSRWVTVELEHWLETRGDTDRLLIALIEGQIQWNGLAGDFDWDQTTALSPKLEGSFTTEPLFVDFRFASGLDSAHLDIRRSSRFEDAVASLAAPIHEIPKDDLVGIDLAELRKSRRLRNLALAVVSILAIVASLAALVAVRSAREAERSEVQAQEEAVIATVQEVLAVEQRNLAITAEKEADKSRAAAETEAREATSRALAAEAIKAIDSGGLDLALLTAVESYRVLSDDDISAHRDSAAVDALLTTLWETPTVERFLFAHDPAVTALALYSSPSENFLISGDAEGSIARWDLPNLVKTWETKLPDRRLQISSAAVESNPLGDFVFATATAMPVSTPGQGPSVKLTSQLVTLDAATGEPRPVIETGVQLGSLVPTTQGVLATVFDSSAVWRITPSGPGVWRDDLDLVTKGIPTPLTYSARSDAIATVARPTVDDTAPLAGELVDGCPLSTEQSVVRIDVASGERANYALPLYQVNEPCEEGSVYDVELVRGPWEGQTDLLFALQEVRGFAQMVTWTEGNPVPVATELVPRGTGLAADDDFGLVKTGYQPSLGILDGCLNFYVQQPRCAQDDISLAGRDDAELATTSVVFAESDTLYVGTGQGTILVRRRTPLVPKPGVSDLDTNPPVASPTGAWMVEREGEFGAVSVSSTDGAIGFDVVGHRDSPTGWVFGPDERLLFTFGNVIPDVETEGIEILAWDLDAGGRRVGTRLVVDPYGPGDHIAVAVSESSVEIRPDGQDVVYTFPATVDALIDSACAIAGRVLTPGEWSETRDPSAPYEPGCQ